MTPSQYAELIKRIEDRGDQIVECTTSWNGFTAGKSYPFKLHTSTSICSLDDDGIHSPVDLTAAANFSGNDWASVDAGEDEKAARSPREHLQHMASFLLTERETYEPGQMVEWIPGLRNLRHDGLMCVIEQVEVFVAKPDGSPFSSSDIELLDLRIAFWSEREGTLREVFVDSRRVKLAKEA